MTGLALSKGFPATPGDGNIFVSGGTTQTDYPTTPGAYQTQFVGTLACTATSPIGFCLPSTNQYVTKLDPAASKLLYSTGINGMDTQPTTNTGLAVDASGSVYVTGTTQSTKYPFTAPPGESPVAIPFVTKLDPAGKSVIWSVHVTGQLNTPWNSGFAPSGTPPPAPTGFPDLPIPCLTNNLTSITESYAVRGCGDRADHRLHCSSGARELPSVAPPYRPTDSSG